MNEPSDSFAARLAPSRLWRLGWALLADPQFQRFLVVGVCNTILGYLLYLLLHLFLPYAGAYALGYAIGIVVQYFAHSRLVYRQSRPRAHLLAYPLLHVVIGGFGTLVLWLLVTRLDVPSHLGGLLAIVAQTPLAFFCTRWWFATADAPRIAIRIATLVLLVAVPLALGWWLLSVLAGA